jgi:hypothetical protein
MQAAEGQHPTAEALARLIRHPTRMHVLFKFAEGTTSPTKVAGSLRVPLNVVSYHTQVLLRAGALELVRTIRRRGAHEHFYRAVLPGDIEDAEWTELPAKLRRVLVRGVIDGAMQECADALVAGGVDPASTHVSRNYFLLDHQGEDELARLLRDSLTRANEIDRACRRRRSADAAPHELVILSFQRLSSP